ncbi:unnamed protein product [Psylliodes chrysocephalus]|uniref:F-box/WD repeat-containing protein 4 n=1 Tax=Psylliodes chrysocephalus TaxID=3402493 RepID=A0A9P0GA37_9CUCU|nr:unnamed protein product [Psylliodes chrysocephala]
MVVSLTLDKLSTELILKICTYLDIEDLCQLKKVCRRFNEIICFWDNVLCKNVHLAVVTNQLDEVFGLKCYRRLSNIEKLRISNNWIKGKYFEKAFLSTRKRFIPYLQITNKFLWISRGETIFCYKRLQSTLHVRTPYATLQGKKNIDIVNFQIKNNVLVSGFRDGGISVVKLSNQSCVLKSQSCHHSDINSVDVSQYGCTVVSGTRENEFKVWNIAQNDSEEVLKQRYCVLLPDLIWKVALSEKNDSKVAIATAGNIYRNSLFIYDLNRMDTRDELEFDHNTIRGIFDARWDGYDTLWTVGFDAYLRRWDLRTLKCVKAYLDPCGSSLYCLDLDHHNTILTGAQLHGRVTLWDYRTGHALQMYYMDSCKNQRYNKSSPVYSLAFDADHLYTVTDQNLNHLDFSVYNATPKDYSFFLD